MFFIDPNFSQTGPEYLEDARKGPQTVFPTLDIFKVQEGTYVWKAAAETFELAKSKVQQLAIIAPGDYMIFSQTTGKKTIIQLDAT